MEKPDICKIVKKYQLVQDLTIHYPDKEVTAEQKKKLNDLIDSYGDFSPTEVKQLLAVILEIGKLLSEKLLNYGTDFEPLILNNGQSAKYQRLKNDAPEKAKKYYSMLLDRHKQREILQKRKVRNARKPGKKAEMEQYWDTWPGDLEETAERTKFVNKMIDLGLASDARTVYQNIKNNWV